MKGTEAFVFYLNDTKIYNITDYLISHEERICTVTHIHLASRNKDILSQTYAKKEKEKAILRNNYVPSIFI